METSPTVYGLAKSPHSDSGYIKQTSTADEPGDNHSDLGEVVDEDDYKEGNLWNCNDAQARICTRKDTTSESDDSDMAKQIEAAGEGESLIGSDHSSSEDHLADEEDYIIQDKINRKLTRISDAGSNSTLDPINKGLGSFFSPTPCDEGNDIVANELFKPQRGFTSSPEPSFSDFFGSSDERDQPCSGDDDNDLTTDEDDDDDISSLESDSTTSDTASLPAPLIAHIGTQPSAARDDQTLVTDGDAAIRNAIPLLVIEDLDGRLIYARAGDGEAVFGSDGEFEFAGDSDEQSSDDDTLLAASNYLPTSQETDVGLLGEDGDTTDELPDEDMPYPRLLIGSIAPHGGRNARRAREIAARSRQSSPHVPLSSPRQSITGQERRRTPSHLSNVIATGDDAETSSDSPEPINDSHASDMAKPEMGQFMPALSKSVHRAVIDGSHRAPSPFNTLHNMQRDLRRKRYKNNDETLDEALQGPLPSKRPRPASKMQYHPPPSEALESSTEPVDLQNNGMDLSDVLDEGLLSQESGGSASDDESELDYDKGNSHRRRRFGSQDKAFARWNRIPMGAFREGQKQGLCDTSPISEAYMTHQRSGGAFLLTHPFPVNRRYAYTDATSPSTSGTRQRPRTPFRHNATAVYDGALSGSPLDRTLVDPTMPPPLAPASNSRLPDTNSRSKVGDHTVVGDRFLVSPVLRPVRHRNAITPNSLGAPSAPAPLPSLDSDEASRRKVTRREKREKLARKAMKRQQSSDMLTPGPSFVNTAK